MYFSQLRVDPSNENTLYVARLPVAKSLDGGKTFATLDAARGHRERRAGTAWRSAACTPSSGTR